MDKLGEGKNLQRGYLPTSTYGQDELVYTELRLTLPKGTKGVYLGWDESAAKTISLFGPSDEEEFLLGRQIRYRVSKSKRQGGLRTIEAEALGQDV